MHVIADTEDPVFVEQRKYLRPKKRVRHSNKWKRKMTAISQEKGEEYTSQTGKQMPKKEIKQGLLCKEKFGMQYDKNYDIEAREGILKKYYSLDINAINSLLFNRIDIKPVA